MAAATVDEAPLELSSGAPFNQSAAGRTFTPLKALGVPQDSVAQPM